jgi:hypothetical protein
MKIYFKILFILFLLHVLSFSGMAQAKNQAKRHDISTNQYDEMAPVMVGNKMVYCSNRPVSGPRTGSTMQNNSFYKIVESEKIGDGKWKPQQMFDESLSSNFHDGPVSFNEKGDYMVLSRCFDVKTSAKATSKFGLFFADKQNGNWGNLQEFEFNDRETNTVYPAFNKDASVLYFASDRAGGFGGYDLYVSRYQNGKWSAPENLGPRINTTDDERFPFLHSSGRLYFSSEGHDNKVGGYDLFYSEFYDRKWISPIKLPPPYNSGVDDYTYYVDSTFSTSFYTNNRRGSRDIWISVDSIPNFKKWQQQRLNNYCFVFYEENTVELDTSLYLYEWDLGDQSKVRAMEAKHCFHGPGNYTVSLNIIDKLTKEVLINQAEYELKVEQIVQTFITCPDTIKTGEDILFSSGESYFRDAKPGEFYWDFGDGTKGRGASVRHTFLVPKNPYVIKLGVKEVNSDPEVVPREFSFFKNVVVTEN